MVASAGRRRKLIGTTALASPDIFAQRGERSLTDARSMSVVANALMRIARHPTALCSEMHSCCHARNAVIQVLQCDHFSSFVRIKGGYL
jgi:hypothetical protein